MTRVKSINGRLNIQIGDVYDFGNGLYKITNKTNKIINTFGDEVNAGYTICWVENVETGKKKHIRESTLEKYLHRWNEVVTE